MSFSVYLSYLIRHVSPTLLLPKKSILENTAKSFYRIPAAMEELGSKTSILENTAKSLPTYFITLTQAIYSVKERQIFRDL